MGTTGCRPTPPITASPFGTARWSMNRWGLCSSRRRAHRSDRGHARPPMTGRARSTDVDPFLPTSWVLVFSWNYSTLCTVSNKKPPIDSAIACETGMVESYAERASNKRPSPRSVDCCLMFVIITSKNIIRYGRAICNLHCDGELMRCWGAGSLFGFFDKECRDNCE